MTETEWLTCDWPCDMLRHLDGKLDDEEFMRFSIACCRRIWPLITDPRSRAVIEATDAYLVGEMTAEAAGQICAVWDRAIWAGDVDDLAGGPRMARSSLFVALALGTLRKSLARVSSLPDTRRQSTCEQAAVHKPRSPKHGWTLNRRSR